MSKIRVRDTDHPDASSKHLADGDLLRSAQPGHFDGAAYLHGYVLECALKTLILHDQCFDSASGLHDPQKLEEWHGKLKQRPFSHQLVTMLSQLVGPVGAPYHPGTNLSAASQGWSPEWRYRSCGAIPARDADDICADAHRLHDDIVKRMLLDGVL